MKTLTICQPWASLIAIGAKKIETRSWYTSYRGLLAIHAGRSRQFDDIMFREPFYSALKPFLTPSGGILLPYGEVIAVCRLVNCLEIGFTYIRYGRVYVELSDGSQIEGDALAFGDFTPGRYAWILEDVRMLPEPVLAKGRPGLWDWEPPEGMV